MSHTLGGLSAWLKSLCLAVMVGFCPGAFAQDDAKAVLAASVGNWNGTLYYLDYQSGERVNIPLRIEAEMTPDNATLIQNAIFTDPGRMVYAIGLSTIDRDSGELVEAAFRQGKGESFRSRVSEVSYHSAEQWRMVFVREGLDGDRRAEIRQTVERTGDSMKSKQQVRYLDGDATFLLRNGIDLTLEE
jgi:hypothetical protein